MMKLMIAFVHHTDGEETLRASVFVLNVERYEQLGGSDGSNT